MLKNLCFLHRLKRGGNIFMPCLGSSPSLAAEELTPAGSAPYLAALAMMYKEAVLADDWCAPTKGLHGLPCIGYCDDVP